MYVCMYVCMYVRAYVCMYVCMYVCVLMDFLPINVRYEVFLDVVKPSELSTSFLREYMGLPTSYYAPGAALKFRKWLSSLSFGVRVYVELCGVIMLSRSYIPTLALCRRNISLLL